MSSTVLKGPTISTSLTGPSYLHIGPLLIIFTDTEADLYKVIYRRVGKNSAVTHNSIIHNEQKIMSV